MSNLCSFMSSIPVSNYIHTYILPERNVYIHKPRYPHSSRLEIINKLGNLKTSDFVKLRSRKRTFRNIHEICKTEHCRCFSEVFSTRLPLLYSHSSSSSSSRYVSLSSPDRIQMSELSWPVYLLFYSYM